MSGIREKGREAWGKLAARTEAELAELNVKRRAAQEKLQASLQSGTDRAQAELGKLESQAAGAPESARAGMRARIGESRAKQEAGWEKLRASLEAEIADAGTSVAQLEAAASGLSGEARERVAHDADEVRAERDKARGKLVANLEAELAEAQSEMETLQKEAADAPPEAAARIVARAEWARARRDAVQGGLQAIR